MPKILLAVSGGPDSLALLAMAHHCFPQQIAAATVDHQLRKEARAEAEYVAQICAERGITHHILTPENAITGNIQSAARNARYALLQNCADEFGYAHIATAHHADDQLETLLMRLSRGSGVDGLAGVRAVNGRIIRPMLAFTKSEIMDICEAAKIRPVDDPSNHILDFDRVKIRKWLAAAPPMLNAAAATRTAAAMDDASKALDWMTENLAAERMRIDGNAHILDAGNLPRELQRRLLITLFARLQPDKQHRGEAIDRLIKALLRGETSTLGDILCTGGRYWKFTPAPPRSRS